MDKNGALQTEHKDLTTLKSKRMRKKRECMVKESYIQQMWNIKAAGQTSKRVTERKMLRVNEQITRCYKQHSKAQLEPLHLTVLRFTDATEFKVSLNTALKSVGPVCQQYIAAWDKLKQSLLK